MGLAVTRVANRERAGGAPQDLRHGLFVDQRAVQRILGKGAAHDQRALRRDQRDAQTVDLGIEGPGLVEDLGIHEAHDDAGERAIGSAPAARDGDRPCRRCRLEIAPERGTEFELQRRVLLEAGEIRPVGPVDADVSTPGRLIDDAAARIEHDKVLEPPRVRHHVTQQDPHRVFVGDAWIRGDSQRRRGELQRLFQGHRDLERVTRRELRKGAELACRGDDRLGAELHQHATEQSTRGDDIGQRQPDRAPGDACDTSTRSSRDRNGRRRQNGG